MKMYSYNGYAIRKKMDKTIPMLIFMLVVVTGGIIGLMTNHPYFISAIILYPMVNMIFSEKSIPCQILVNISENTVLLTYKDVQRGEKARDEIYEFSKMRIRRIHWIKEQKRLGIYGYPIIKYKNQNGELETYDCKKEKKRKRIYISYPYDELQFNVNKN